MVAREYSRRLGSIDDDQFRSALERLGLGEFVRAEPLAGGLFGQNVFVAGTTGEYVLRGAPHYEWQRRHLRLELRGHSAHARVEALGHRG